MLLLLLVVQVAAVVDVAAVVVAAVVDVDDVDVAAVVVVDVAAADVAAVNYGVVAVFRSCCCFWSHCWCRCCCTDSLDKISLLVGRPWAVDCCK